MQCTRPLYLEKYEITVPCLKCDACKKSRASLWALRLTHEMMYHEDSCFITLTYSDENLPEGGTLVKPHLQNFFKRLRRNSPTLFLRYYSCGEYGSNTFRPHYHAILFGLNSTHRTLIEKAWSLHGEPIGFVTVGECSVASIRYVTGYIQKKVMTKFDQYYKDLNLQPPFNLQSQGLGLRYAQDNCKMLDQRLSCKFNGNTVSLPRYYARKLEIDPAKLQALAEERSEKAIADILQVHNIELPAELSGYPSAYILRELKRDLRITSANELHLAAQNEISRQGSL